MQEKQKEKKKHKSRNNKRRKWLFSKWGEANREKEVCQGSFLTNNINLQNSSGPWPSSKKFYTPICGSFFFFSLFHSRSLISSLITLLPFHPGKDNNFSNVKLGFLFLRTLIWCARCVKSVAFWRKDRIREFKVAERMEF